MGLWFLLISLVVLIMIIDAIVFIGRRKKRSLIYIAIGLIFAYLIANENNSNQNNFLNSNNLRINPINAVQRQIVHEGIGNIARGLEDSGRMKKGEFAKIEGKIFRENQVNKTQEIDWEKEAAKMRRDQAFKAFYQKPSRCLSPENEQEKMDCINEHVRAWKQFIITYKG